MGNKPEGLSYGYSLALCVCVEIILNPSSVFPSGTTTVLVYR
jgi:hypothetical protein